MKGEEVIMRHWQELRKYACFNIYYNIDVCVCVWFDETLSNRSGIFSFLCAQQGSY